MIQKNDSTNVNNINRHLSEMEKRMPYFNSGKERVVRSPLDYYKKETVVTRVNQALRMAEGQHGVEGHDAEGLRVDMDQFTSDLLNARNNYVQSARALDGEGAGSSGFVDLLGSVVVLALDFVAFTFTFYALIDSIYGKKLARPELSTIVVMAAPVAAAMSVAMRFGAHEAGRSKAWLTGYLVAWACLAIADISYLMRQGIANVGLALTGLLIVMCLVTLGHGRTAVSTSGRKRQLELHAQAYFEYWRKIDQLARALRRLKTAPWDGLDDILYPQHEEPYPVGEETETEAGEDEGDE